mgnify:FL=1
MAKKSSLIRNIQYISYKKELYVRLNGNEETGEHPLYVYYDVPKETVSEFKTAGSLGSFFNKKIKDDYNYELITV